ncbi:MAG TPA: thioesterase family protein [Vicinamibacterales bacterium]|jgi:YbgC/YbaW family acyl-CoA thioester hydrolase|nr:thioesterase family protein [Vicinamibacterales bacterium]
MSAHSTPVGGFRYTRRVQFHETDLAGVVHFSCFFRYMEEAEHALWRAAGLTIDRAGGDSGWPRVAATFDFKRPLYFEDEVEILVRLASVTSRSIQYAFAFTRGASSIGAGTLTAVHARRDGGRMHAITIPSDVVARLRSTCSAAL